MSEKPHGSSRVPAPQGCSYYYCSKIISPFCGVDKIKPKTKKTKAPKTAVLWIGEVFPHPPGGRSLFHWALSCPGEVRVRDVVGEDSTERQWLGVSPKILCLCGTKQSAASVSDLSHTSGRPRLLLGVSQSFTATLL